jgi:two-component system CheB/CheR fusion protein
MVGPDAKIRRFTPKASQILNLIPTDVGRSIGDIRPDIQAPDLDDVVAEVMASLLPKEFEAQDKQGAWWRLQIRPYRTADNRIDGAVIAMANITALKSASEVLKIAHDDARNIIETMPSPIVVISSDQRCQMANSAFYSLFEVEPLATVGKFLTELCDGRWNIPSLIAKLETVLTEGVAFHDLSLELDFPKIGHKSLVLHATATRLTGAGSNTAMLAIEDLTARQETAERLRHTEERYRHLLENANDGIAIVNENGTIEFANHRLENMFGYSSGELQNKPYEILIPD